jgi:hypothetical protein
MFGLPRGRRGMMSHVGGGRGCRNLVWGITEERERPSRLMYESGRIFYLDPETTLLPSLTCTFGLLRGEKLRAIYGHNTST